MRSVHLSPPLCASLGSTYGNLRSLLNCACSHPSLGCKLLTSETTLRVTNGLGVALKIVHLGKPWFGANEYGCHLTALLFIIVSYHLSTLTGI